MRCVFQQIEGAAMREGLWLTSTASNALNDRFPVVAMAVGRAVGNVTRAQSTRAGQVVRFTRPGLVEEYTVSMDGVRQDFVVRQRPASAGELRVQLAV